MVAARAIRAEHGSTMGILLLSQYVEAGRAIDLFADGTSGLAYPIKDRVLDPTELTDALRRVADGGSAIPSPRAPSARRNNRRCGSSCQRRAAVRAAAIHWP